MTYTLNTSLALKYDMLSTVLGKIIVILLVGSYYPFKECICNLVLNLRQGYEKLVLNIYVMLRFSYCINVRLVNTLFHNIGF